MFNIKPGIDLGDIWKHGWKWRSTIEIACSFGGSSNCLKKNGHNAHWKHRATWLPPRLPSWRRQQQEQSLIFILRRLLHSSDHSCGSSSKGSVYFGGFSLPCYRLSPGLLFCSPILWLLLVHHACAVSSLLDRHTLLSASVATLRKCFWWFYFRHSADSLAFTFLTSLIHLYSKATDLHQNVYQHLKFPCSKQRPLSFHVCFLLMPAVFTGHILLYPSQQGRCLPFTFPAATTGPEILPIFFCKALVLATVVIITWSVSAVFPSGLQAHTPFLPSPITPHPLSRKFSIAHICL